MNSISSHVYLSSEKLVNSSAKPMLGRVIYPQLTGIRAVAVCLVFAHHYNLFPIQSWGERILREFHIGVSIFFVLSGFLITLRYHDKVELKRTWLFKYFKNRFARIYPVFFLLTCFSYAIIFRHSINKNVIFEFLSTLLLIKAFFKDIIFTGLGQAWSLTVEECFYALAPIVFWLHVRYGKWVFCLPIWLLAIGFGLVAIGHGHAPLGFFADTIFMLQRTFFGRCVEFFVGIALAYSFLAGRRLPIRYLTWLGLAAMAVCVWGLISFQVGNTQGIYTYGGVIIDNFILPFGIGCLFWGLLTERTWLARLLSTQPFVLLGKSSYVFYLIHVGTISRIIHDAFPYGWVLHFILLNLLSITIYNFVEEPLNKYIRNK